MSEVSTVKFDKAMKQDAEVNKGQEMGVFMYGGSSYVMIFQKLPGKELFFQNATGTIYDKSPELPKGSASVGGITTNIGAQIGKWETVDMAVDSTMAWQNTGYVNASKAFTITCVGGQWTANPNSYNGNLYGPNGNPTIITKPGYPMEGVLEGALIARVGDNPPFLVGKGPVNTPTGQTGQLQFCINDSLADNLKYLTDNEGVITVSVVPAC